jgi:hypothetical protein
MEVALLDRMIDLIIARRQRYDLIVFDTAPTGHPIYYVYYHEPEDNIAADQFKAADYKAAWAHVVKLADAAHNPWLHSTLVLMNWDLEHGSGRNWKDYLPGGGIISTLGWDAYPVGSAVNNNPQPMPPQFMGLHRGLQERRPAPSVRRVRPIHRDRLYRMTSVGTT